MKTTIKLMLLICLGLMLQMPMLSAQTAATTETGSHAVMVLKKQPNGEKEPKGEKKATAAKKAKGEKKEKAMKGGK